MLEELILSEAKEVREKYPQGFNKDKCLDASYELQQRLLKLGISCSLQFGTFNKERHSWLDVWIPGGMKLLDVTADQWRDNVPDIIFAKMNEYPQYGWEEN